MTTTIKSTELDFQQIKESLKDFLKAGGEFNDFDFEGSGINNILDVLAYNTHYNALQTNFALNESFLVTAQLRPSVVSLAESIGYIPDSKKSSTATIGFSVNASGIAGISSAILILEPGEIILRGTKDRIDYTFTNRTSIKAEKNSSGTYNFYPVSSPDDPILVSEGDEKTIQFVVGSSKDSVYIVPDKDIDISTAIVKVYENQGSASAADGAYNVFTDLIDASTISSDSRLYVLRESPNTFYELSFGNGTSLGVAPQPGNVVEVNYLQTHGAEANGISQVSKLASEIYLDGIIIPPENVSVFTKEGSAGGIDKEGIESIRKNAPFQFAAQNRMVTSDDYSSLILKKYSAFIKDIQSWGGEDNPEPDYGTVFTSIVWSDNISATTIANTRQGILDLSDQFQIASFKLTFTDPVVTYITTEIYYQFNPSLTGLSSSNVRGLVSNTVEDYFSENTGKFSQTFRQSNLLTRVDATEPSVLSSRANVILSRRVIPQLGFTKSYQIKFPAAIRDPSLAPVATVYSSNFSHFLGQGQSVFIRNSLSSRIKVSSPGEDDIFETRASNILEMVGSDGNVILDNIGSYDTVLGTVTIDSLKINSIPGNVNYIKIFAVPANQSVINSVRNNILQYDDDTSIAQPIEVETR